MVASDRTDTSEGISIGADKFSPAFRSRVMSRVPHQNTAPEVALRRGLWERGLRYRVQHKVAGVKVDIAFPGRQVAVFVDGCFWHGCNKHYVAPVNRADYWREKLERNIGRDLRNNRDLQDRGWTVVRVWTHEFRNDCRQVCDRILRVLNRAGGVKQTTELAANCGA